ncbi:MAG TPA: hypothetical protein VFJ58_29895 [Armatimonadota bacterium]|nr:hypothetical protein [Armatimonadota bacterium]
MKVRFAQAFVAGLAVVVTLLPSAGIAAGKMANHHKMTSHGKMAAHGKMASHKKKPASVKCPICKMTMMSTKSKGAPVRVLVNHHYYYCCAACGYKGQKTKASSKKSSHMSKMSGHKSKMGGHMGKMKM